MGEMLRSKVPEIEVSFRRIFTKQPVYEVGDKVRTTFDPTVTIVKREKDVHQNPRYTYTVETPNGKTKLVHESAILGKIQTNKQSTLFSAG
jgi:hypothetical protein